MGSQQQKGKPTQALSTQVRSNLPAELWSEDQIQILMNTFAKGATKDEFALFAHVCKRTELDPFKKQIHFTKRKNRRTGKEDLVMITGIDGYRALAARSGDYAGSDPPVFEPADESAKYPTKASCTVYKMVNGQRVPFTGVCRWKEYAPKNMDAPSAFYWNKAPYNQLGKCAEAQALRKGWPEEVGELRTKAEIDSKLGEEPQETQPLEPRRASVVEAEAKVKKSTTAPPPPPVVMEQAPPKEEKPKEPPDAFADVPEEEQGPKVGDTGKAEGKIVKLKSEVVNEERIYYVSLQRLDGKVGVFETKNEQFAKAAKMIGIGKDCQLEWEMALSGAQILSITGTGGL
jgi:phage recombination protein Bet